MLCVPRARQQALGRRYGGTMRLRLRGSRAAQGISQAVPKAILALMNVEGMTRENVASHLQKYRIWLKRLAGFPPGARVSPEMLQQVHPAALHQACSL